MLIGAQCISGKLENKTDMCGVCKWACLCNRACVRACVRLCMLVLLRICLPLYVVACVFNCLYNIYNEINDETKRLIGRKSIKPNLCLKCGNISTP